MGRQAGVDIKRQRDIARWSREAQFQGGDCCELHESVLSGHIPFTKSALGGETRTCGKVWVQFKDGDQLKINGLY